MTDDASPWQPIAVRSAVPHVATGVALSCGDLFSNLQPGRGGLLVDEGPVLVAGLRYPEPWLRDAAVNAWNAAVLTPIAARNSLLRVVERTAGGYVLPHPDYYDGVIWVVGAHHYALVSGDREFLALAHAIATDVLARFRMEEFDPVAGLYRGGSFFNDGVSAYPDTFTAHPGYWGNIRDWLQDQPERAPLGGGLPMFCLSTNCLHLLALQAAVALRERLDAGSTAAWREQAAALRLAIRRHFLLADGRLAYLIDRGVRDERQEISGWAFACLAGVLERDEQRRLAAQAFSATAGIPSLWPTYARYAVAGGVGRHSGLVWPQASALWGSALVGMGAWPEFRAVFESLLRGVVRHGHCAECWHATTGDLDGGLQERGGIGIVRYEAMPRMTWGATGILRLVIDGLAGLRPAWDACELRPCLLPGLGPLDIRGLRWRGLCFHLELSGEGDVPVALTVDGRAVDRLHFTAQDSGERRITVELRPSRGNAP